MSPGARPPPPMRPSRPSIEGGAPAPGAPRDTRDREGRPAGERRTLPHWQASGCRPSSQHRSTDQTHARTARASRDASQTSRRFQAGWHRAGPRGSTGGGDHAPIMAHPACYRWCFPGCTCVPETVPVTESGTGEGGVPVPVVSLDTRYTVHRPAALASLSQA